MQTPSSSSLEKRKWTQPQIHCVSETTAKNGTEFEAATAVYCSKVLMTGGSGQIYSGCSGTTLSHVGKVMASDCHAAKCGTAS